MTANEYRDKLLTNICVFSFYEKTSEALIYREAVGTLIPQFLVDFPFTDTGGNYNHDIQVRYYDFLVEDFRSFDPDNIVEFAEINVDKLIPEVDKLLEDGFRLLPDDL